MSTAKTAPWWGARRWPGSAAQKVLLTLLTALAVVTMHAVTAHAGVLTTSMTPPAPAMAPMAADAHAGDHGGAPRHGEAPISPHELVALCGVIVLASLTPLTRPTVATRHTPWSLFRHPQSGSRPDPPVPRLALAFI